MKLATWMATATGRGLRMLAGLVLIGVGLAVGGVAGVIVAIVGLVPLLAGVTNVCLVAPVVRAPFRGSRVRGA
ncbi:MAG: DUF2892 domain-containing protein [Candidatus Dormibacteraeota bacterium]|nr:DUF2892 domain-containing protein [Candidatus Dormibacteraeota bacterium]